MNNNRTYNTVKCCENLFRLVMETQKQRSLTVAGKARDRLEQSPEVEKEFCVQTRAGGHSRQRTQAQMPGGREGQRPPWDSQNALWPKPRPTEDGGC